MTGAGSGIGRAVVLRLASAGANVLALGRTKASLAETVSAAAGARGKVSWTECDVLWVCMRAQLKRLFDAGRGSIVNCASVAVHLGHAGSPIYSATKHAVIGLSKSAALQYASRGVRVNVVSPGSTDTPILRTIYPSEEALDARRRRAPLRRLGSPDEVASAVLWLLDPSSGYVTGQTAIVDGGVTAGSPGPDLPMDVVARA